MKFNHEDEQNKEKTIVKTGVGLVATESARRSTEQVAEKFAKPDSYTGNRTLYDSGAAKRRAKTEKFKNGSEVRDPYTGNKLVSSKREAKSLYGDEWQDHLGEIDHNQSIEKIYNDTKGNAWITIEDIKNAANSKENLTVTSRKFNNAKRSRTNEEFVSDQEYLNKKGIKLSEGAEKAAIEAQKNAEAAINKKLFKSGVKNCVETGHKSGMLSAADAATFGVTMSTITNIVAVISGEKEAEKAISDIVKDGGVATVTGYTMGSALTVVSHSLSESSSKFIQALVKSNVPGKIVTAVMTTGDTLLRYAEGELSTEECVLELGEKGVNIAATGGSMVVGQALIPIPVVGAAVGAFVGSQLTSWYCNEIRSYLNELEQRAQERQECQRIKVLCEQAKVTEQTFRVELESYLKNYFNDYWKYLDGAFEEMQSAFMKGDADGVIANSNKITKKLGGNVYYETVRGFRGYLMSDVEDEL